MKKIDIFVDGSYVASTTQRKTCKAAVAGFMKLPVVQGVGGARRIAAGRVTARFAQPRKRRK